MSGLKQRIHPLQVRYVAAAVPCAWRSPAAPSLTGCSLGRPNRWKRARLPGLNPSSLRFLPKEEAIEPPREASATVTAGDPPSAESAPTPPENPANRPAKVAAPAAPAAAEPAPVAATEGVTVDVTGAVSVLSSEPATVTATDPNQPAAPASPAFPAPPPAPPSRPGALTMITGGEVGAAASRSARVRGELRTALSSQEQFEEGCDQLRKVRRAAPGPGMLSRVDPNRLKVVDEEPVSTFSIDVDTAAYSFVRASLQQGTLRPRRPFASRS